MLADVGNSAMATLAWAILGNDVALFARAPEVGKARRRTAQDR